MSWFERVIDLLSSREWLLLMMIAVVIGAFTFPDYRMGEEDKEKMD